MDRSARRGATPVEAQRSWACRKLPYGIKNAQLTRETVTVAVRLTDPAYTVPPASHPKKGWLGTATATIENGLLGCRPDTHKRAGTLDADLTLLRI